MASPKRAVRQPSRYSWIDRHASWRDQDDQPDYLPQRGVLNPRTYAAGRRQHTTVSRMPRAMPWLPASGVEQHVGVYTIKNKGPQAGVLYPLTFAFASSLSQFS